MFVILDIDECQEQPHLCGPGGTCRNTQGSFQCICNRGYKLDPTGKKCIGESNLDFSLNLTLVLLNPDIPHRCKTV